jgi:hypothetical protein
MSTRPTKAGRCPEAERINRTFATSIIESQEELEPITLDAILSRLECRVHPESKVRRSFSRFRLGVGVHDLCDAPMRAET